MFLNVAASYMISAANSGLSNLTRKDTRYYSTLLGLGKPNIMSGCGYRLVFPRDQPINSRDAKTRVRVAKELKLLLILELRAKQTRSSNHSTGVGSGGRCRIRTYDFHRVKVTLYR